MLVIAIGDSLASGVGDLDLADAPTAWSGRLARMIGATDHVNLARPGATAQNTVASQLRHALHLKPDIALVSIGGNDILDLHFNETRLNFLAQTILASLTACAQHVTMLTLPDFSRTWPAPPRLRRRLHRRVAIANDALIDAAERFGTTLIDRRRDYRALDPRYLHADRVHPSPRGYQWLAEATAGALGLAITHSSFPTEGAPLRRGRSSATHLDRTDMLRCLRRVPVLTALAIAPTRT